ncbi:hypothetical protein EVAR_20693_1 [Eumeta japonica]|uniref:Uncharacterized protein n=1 Tax=Eumeta variegata TaxID=151549 RepID=A0A4C1V9Q5_EUMVA|nr:hypothetical protein EVAR_20693_1 [Eumeta japonica]
MADEDESVHRLEGTSEATKGGLFVMKKDKPKEFEFAKPSLLGLDKLAEAKRKQNRLMSFNQDDQETDDELARKHRKYRKPNEETPTYTGGISEQARERIIDRLQRYSNVGNFQNK